MTNTVIAYIGMGANLGNAARSLYHAYTQLSALPATATRQLAGFYSSAPVDADGPDYINTVATIETALPAKSLLSALQTIEQQHGRVRSYTNAPRTLDLDLLLYGDQHIHSADLIVPHPRMHLRAFVLRPLAELAPTLRLAQGSLEQLLAACADQAIHRLDPQPVF